MLASQIDLTWHQNRSQIGPGTRQAIFQKQNKKTCVSFTKTLLFELRSSPGAPQKRPRNPKGHDWIHENRFHEKYTMTIHSKGLISVNNKHWKHDVCKRHWHLTSKYKVKVTLLTKTMTLSHGWYDQEGGRRREPNRCLRSKRNMIQLSTCEFLYQVHRTPRMSAIRMC